MKIKRKKNLIYFFCCSYYPKNPPVLSHLLDEYGILKIINQIKIKRIKQQNRIEQNFSIFKILDTSKITSERQPLAATIVEYGSHLLFPKPIPNKYNKYVLLLNLVVVVVIYMGSCLLRCIADFGDCSFTLLYGKTYIFQPNTLEN